MWYLRYGFLGKVIRVELYKGYLWVLVPAFMPLLVRYTEGVLSSFSKLGQLTKQTQTK